MTARGQHITDRGPDEGQGEGISQTGALMTARGEHITDKGPDEGQGEHITDRGPDEGQGGTYHRQGPWAKDRGRTRTMTRARTRVRTKAITTAITRQRTKDGLYACALVCLVLKWLRGACFACTKRQLLTQTMWKQQVFAHVRNIGTDDSTWRCHNCTHINYAFGLNETDGPVPTFWKQIVFCHISEWRFHHHETRVFPKTC